jgi:hypothetical protein
MSDEIILGKDYDTKMADQLTLRPYRKHYFDPAKGAYSRSINMYGFAENKHGEIVGIGAKFWPPGEVGQTINRTINPKIPIYTRIREAHVCLRGNIAYARAKQKQRRHFFLGKLATNPS